MNRWTRAVLGVVLAGVFAGALSFKLDRAATGAQPAASNAKKLPKLLDLGSKKCIPCKKMAPILEQLREEYKSRLSVEFIDVWKDPSAKEPYNIRLIPTQILFDTEGNEVWRHEGFISKEDLKTVFTEKVGIK